MQSRNVSIKKNPPNKSGGFAVGFGKQLCFDMGLSHICMQQAIVW